MPKRPTHLVIPDAHADSRYDNLRFRSLGLFAAETRPDVIISLGDFADMPSLALQEKGKLSFEGRRYKDDIEATIDAQRELFKPIRKAMSRGSHRAWNPHLVLCLGNHEQRIIRACNDTPELAGKLDIADLRYQEFGWRVYPFQTPVLLDQIAYCHCFAAGVRGKPISGDNIGRQLCLRLHNSAVVGHSHLYSHAESATVAGKRIFGLSAGCFVHPEMMESWSDGTRHLWWRGVVLLKDCDGQGYYDAIEAVTLRKIMRDYS